MMSKTNEFRWPGYKPNSPDHQQLKLFLFTDIQHSPSAAQEVLEGIRAFIQDPAQAYSGSGNGYYFECQANGLFLEHHYPEADPIGEVVVPFDDVIEGLQEWKKQIS